MPATPPRLDLRHGKLVVLRDGEVVRTAYTDYNAGSTTRSSECSVSELRAWAVSLLAHLDCSEKRANDTINGA